MKKDEIKEKYEKVSNVLNDALNQSGLINVKGKKEKISILDIKRQLSEMNSEFSKDINELEKSAVWDKLRVTYFGETNAGKSTIIDALRIAFDEKTRNEQIDRNKAQYKNELDTYKNIATQLHTEIENLKNIRNVYIMKKTYIIILGIVIFIFGILFGYILFRIVV